MITTNLTLTNGATSEIPIQVVGITFEVDSKLTVNPSIVFPLTVAINSSEIIGIDFDDAINSGDFTESITINTIGGIYDIVHTVNIEDTSTMPTAITDFEAINGSGQITFSWTDSVGVPTPTYNIFENDIEIATDVDQSYVRTIVAGIYAYKVEASNLNGDVASNSNIGISTEVPSDILDFIADDGVEVATMHFTPATGYPTPRHQLYEDDVLVVGADNIADGYIHSQAVAGTYSYRVEAYNGVGSPITSNSDDAVVSEGTPALVPPSEILDFVASDLDVGSITMTWTDATGNPLPTYALYENNVAVVGAEDISDGYVHTVAAGTYTYRVDAINSEGTQPSNDNDGTSTSSVGAVPTVFYDGFLTTDATNRICRDEVGDRDLLYPLNFMTGSEDGLHDGLVFLPTDAPILPIDMLDTDLGAQFVIEFVVARAWGDGSDDSFLLYSREYLVDMWAGIRLYLNLSTIDDINCTMYNTAGSGTSTSANVADTDLHHMAFTFDGTTLTAYMDGVETDTADYSTIPFAPSGFSLASELGGLDGVLRMVKLWDEVAYPNYDIAVEYQKAVSDGYLTPIGAPELGADFMASDTGDFMVSATGDYMTTVYN